MTMTKYKIISNYRNHFYIINEQGEVLETQNGVMTWQPGTWKITGAWYHKGFGHIGYIPLSQLLKTDKLLYKNGKPIYGLTDLDHGSYRMHGNKDIHGIKFIFTEQDEGDFKYFG